MYKFLKAIVDFIIPSPRSDIERYLSKATNIHDLESRQRDVMNPNFNLYY